MLWWSVVDMYDMLTTIKRGYMYTNTADNPCWLTDVVWGDQVRLVYGCLNCDVGTTVDVECRENEWSNVETNKDVGFGKMLWKWCEVNAL